MSRDLARDLAQIEGDVDGGRYRPGPWQSLVRRVLQRPRGERLALAADISRVSRKLHGRARSGTLSVAAGVGLELLATTLGGGLLRVGIATGSNVAALAAMTIFVTTFQPLLKLAVGWSAGVRYDYAYLAGAEPRFKMRYGTYVSAPRWRRIVVHLSGMLGSPMAAQLVATLVWPRLPLAAHVSRVMFWAILGLNGLFFVSALCGARRLGFVTLSTSSGGAAACELRQSCAPARVQDRGAPLGG